MTKVVMASNGGIAESPHERLPGDWGRLSVSITGAAPYSV